MVMHDKDCPYWDQVRVIKQHKTQTQTVTSACIPVQQREQVLETPWNESGCESGITREIVYI